MMYICAWHAPELQPEALISSRMTLAAVSPSPAPPYSSGTSAASQPGLGQRDDELLGVAVGLERPPVLTGEVPAELAHRGADLGKLGCGLEVHAPSTGLSESQMSDFEADTTRHARGARA